MTIRTDVAPSTLPVTLEEGGVEVEYLDGRTAFYRGVPEKVTETLSAAPGKAVHVLVTDPDGTEGVLMYVNDRKTHEDILESTGVGRIVLDGGETEEIFPGVTVGTPDGMRCRVQADLSTARGRVFVFVEDDWGEESYELVAGD
ncbi:hypothetical protein EI982_08865 [Haloplanus rallus]|jgi:hypothetical protein|uniref:Uncharacterized protein n=1 Tax=Haloplanus rallus TaxID=1816183 RepID=A0A6B9FE07_9EURY|nr:MULTISPECIES: DUF5796 family protein [Haloplanus]QGX94890.1 hypothetical protein EI982_08865 [Haloplanus rallus]